MLIILTIILLILQNSDIILVALLLLYVLYALYVLCISQYCIEFLCRAALAVVPDDEFCDPLSLDDPPGACTTPTPPVVPSPSPSPAPMRQRAMEHLRPVSIPDIVRTMAGKNPVHEMADFDRHYMPGGLLSPDASARGNAMDHSSE